MNEIFVTNKNDFYHEDKFNGQTFQFPSGEKVLVPVEAARLFFGFGMPDKTEALVRQGWANQPNDAGVFTLAKFVFTQGVMVEVPVDDVAASAERAAA